MYNLSEREIDIQKRIKSLCPMVDIEDFNYAYQNIHDDYDTEIPVEILDETASYEFLRNLDERLCSIINDAIAEELGKHEEDDGI